jgi:hypothetical protein
MLLFDAGRCRLQTVVGVLTIAYPGMAEIVARVEQALSRRVPAIAATFGRP